MGYILDNEAQRRVLPTVRALLDDMATDDARDAQLVAMIDRGDVAEMGAVLALLLRASDTFLTVNVGNLVNASGGAKPAKRLRQEACNRAFGALLPD